MPYKKPAEFKRIVGVFHPGEVRDRGPVGSPDCTENVVVINIYVEIAPMCRETEGGGHSGPNVHSHINSSDSGLF